MVRPRAVRLYGAFLRLLPPEVCRADGGEMEATFASLWRDAEREGGRVGLCLRSFGRLPGVAVREWVDHVNRGAPDPGRRPGSGAMERLSRVVRHGVRSLRRSPSFVWSVVLLLGLGVGSVTTIFTLVDHVMLRPLPYPAAERLFTLENGAHSGPIWRGLQDFQSVEAWAAVRTETANMTGQGRPEQLRAATVSEGFFAVFGARPVLGRLLVAEDFPAQQAVVISEGLWRRGFGGDPDVVGRPITLDGTPRVIAGVMTGSFTPPEALTSAGVDVWLPIDWTHADYETQDYHVLSVAGRLAPGATLENVRTEVDGLAQRLAEIEPDRWRSRDGTMRTLPPVALQDATVGGEVRQGLGLLLGAVTLLLLVACTNVAHLFMARGLARVREMAVRRALGARTGALAGQLLAESAMIGLVGAGLGVVLAYGGVAALLALSPEAIPRASAVQIDVRVLAFAVGVGVLTALCFGMLPALRLVQRDTSSGALHATGRGNSDTRRDRRLRSTLVIVEVALSLVLVVQAGALLRSFAALNAEDLGFRTDDVWTVPLEPRNVQDPADWARRMEPVRQALAAVPGVQLATYGMTMPLEWVGGSRCCWSGRPEFPGTDAEPETAYLHVVDADYFPLLEIRFLAGRAWTRAEERTEPAPAVISEALAVRVFGSAADAIGRQVEAGRTSLHVVGVVTDNRHYGPDQPPGEAVYLPAARIPFPLDRAHMAILVGPSAAGIADRLREAVWTVEPDLPVPTIRTLEDWAGDATARARFEAALFTTFGAVALLLVAGGLYGTLLYGVSRRRRELGIRLALGDAPGRLERSVLRQGVTTAIIGCAFGAAGAWAAGRLLASRLSGLDTGRPGTFAAAIAVLCAVALIASWLPARRAARTDPLEALRAE